MSVLKEKNRIYTRSLAGSIGTIRQGEQRTKSTANSSPYAVATSLRRIPSLNRSRASQVTRALLFGTLWLSCTQSESLAPVPLFRLIGTPPSHWMRLLPVVCVRLIVVRSSDYPFEHDSTRSGAYTRPVAVAVVVNISHMKGRLELKFFAGSTHVRVRQSAPRVHVSFFRRQLT